MIDRFRQIDNIGLARWGFLLLVSLVIAANYYAYDAMSSIKATLQQELGISSTQYGIVVSFYSFPNVFLLMAVLGGIFLDRFGIRRTGILFTFFCAAGVLLTAYGTSDAYRQGGLGFDLFGSFMKGYSPELKMMILGRLLYGLGAETSIVVINKIIAKWFKKKELAFAFALNLAVARLGTAAALIFSPRLVEAPTGWTTPLWVAAMLMGSGLVFFIVYAVFDRRLTPSRTADGKLAEDEIFRASDILDLFKNRAFLYITALCVTFYSAVFPFQAFCPDFLHNKFDLSLKTSGDLTSVIIWGTILFTPLFGLFSDKKGRRATLMIYGSIMLLFTHLVLSLTSITPYLAMFVLGIAFSLVPAAMWPSVALIVAEKRLGTAYGLMASIQNIGLFAFPILAGWITDSVNRGLVPDPASGQMPPLEYTYTILMFAGLGLVGLLFAFLLRHESLREGGPKLELPSGAD